MKTVCVRVGGQRGSNACLQAQWCNSPTKKVRILASASGLTEGWTSLFPLRSPGPRAGAPAPRSRDVGWRSGLSQMWGAQAGRLGTPTFSLAPNTLTQQFPKGPSTSSETWNPLHFYVFSAFSKYFRSLLHLVLTTHTREATGSERGGDFPGSQPQGQTAPGSHPCPLQVPLSRQSASLHRTF